MGHSGGTSGSGWSWMVLALVGLGFLGPWWGCCEGLGWQDDIQPRIKLNSEPEDTITFSGNNTHRDYFRIFVRDGKYLLVGARNVVYNLTINGLKLTHKLEWYSEDMDVQMCTTKGKDAENCQNYIRVLSVVGPGKLLVCGTNAYKPFCGYYQLSPSGHYYLVGDRKSGQGICPYDPKHNSTSIVVDGMVFGGTVADFTEVDPLIHRWDSLRTTQYDLKYLNAPNFVNSMQYGDFVFFFFRETSQESTNCGKAIYSRVGRVCKGDRGFPRGSQKNRWTTFFKSRLNCSIPGEFPFSFDEIQSMSIMMPTSQLGSEVVYGVFTTGINSLTGSAVCAFKMRDILDVFDGSFKAQEKEKMQWLPVPSVKVPEPRPGLCVNDSTTLPDQYYIFVAGHTLMDEPVQPIYGKPILTRAEENYRFTTIAVQTNVTSVDGVMYDVLFMGTDDGKVLTAVNIGRETSKPVLITEVQLFPTFTPVREMLFLGGASPPKLLVGSDDTLKLMSVRQCFTSKIKSCSECVGLRSPYCAWHKKSSKCVSIPSDGLVSKRDYLQNLIKGNHSDCPRSQSTNPSSSSSSSNTNPILSGISSSSSSSSSSANTDGSINSPKSDTTVLNKNNKATADDTNTNNNNKDNAEDPVAVGPRRDLITAETLYISVGVGVLLAVLLGVGVGWGCARRCGKDHDNIPYPDTDYEYFEQRHNLNINTRLVGGEGKEEATYAEPVLTDAKNSTNNMGGGGGMNNMHGGGHGHQMGDPHQETTMFHFAQPYGPGGLYRFEGDRGMMSGRGVDQFGSLRPGQNQNHGGGGGMVQLDGYSVPQQPPHVPGMYPQSNNKNMPASMGNLPPMVNDGYGTARSVKKVYL